MPEMVNTHLHLQPVFRQPPIGDAHHRGVVDQNIHLLLSRMHSFRELLYRVKRAQIEFRAQNVPISGIANDLSSRLLAAFHVATSHDNLASTFGEFVSGFVSYPGVCSGYDRDFTLDIDVLFETGALVEFSDEKF